MFLKYILKLIVFLNLILINISLAESFCHDVESTTEVNITLNLNSNSAISSGIPYVSNAGNTTYSTTTYAQLALASDFSSSFEAIDSLGAAFNINLYFYHTNSREYIVGAYIDSELVDPTGTDRGLPRKITRFTLNFDADGNLLSANNFNLTFQKINGSETLSINVNLSNISYSNLTPSINTIPNGNKTVRNEPKEELEENLKQNEKIIYRANYDSDALTISSIPTVSFAGGTPISTVTYAQLDTASSFKHTFKVDGPSCLGCIVYIYLYRTSSYMGYDMYSAALYITSDDIGESIVGLPRLLSMIDLIYTNKGLPQSANTVTFSIPWPEGTYTYEIDLSQTTQFAGISEVCSAKIDSCPSDNNKTEPGVCGCGTSEVDLDNNGIIDCLEVEPDPDFSTKPKEASINISNKTTTLEFAKYADNFSYFIQFRSRRGRKIRISSNSNTVLRKLKFGRWKVRYRLYNSTSNTFSPFSKWQGFRVKRKN